MLYNILDNRRHILGGITAILSLFAFSLSGNNRDEILPGTIRLYQTDKYQHIAISNTHRISLPIIVKEVVTMKWSIAPQSLEQPNITRYTTEEKKEIRQLSEKLGIRIRNAEDVPLYREAVKWLGTRYRWAGNSSKGVDCSGLTSILIRTVYNKELSRSSHLIANELSQEIDTDNLRPGDLVFFSTRRYKRINHVGVYLGDRQFIHASRKGVVVSSLDDQYYTRTLKKAGRL